MGNEQTLTALRKAVADREEYNLLQAAGRAADDALKESGGTFYQTLPEKIVAVAGFLPQPFSRSQLVLACWTAYPRDFGLAGCPERHPDANRVWSHCCGKKGLVDRGKLTRVGEGLLTTLTGAAAGLGLGMKAEQAAPDAIKEPTP